MEEDELIERIKRGDEKSVPMLYNIHGTRIFRFAYRMLGVREDAEDIVQETFFRACACIQQFRGESRIGTWLYSIARNLCLRRLDKKKWSSFSSLEELTQTVAEPPDSAWGEPEDRFLVDQVREGCLLGLLRCLAFHQRAAFILHVLLGLPVEETAAVIEKSKSATRVLVHRARQNLKRYLCRNCSLYDARNPCRCRNLINFSLKQGWIGTTGGADPAFPHVGVEQIASEINSLRRITALYHSLPDRMPSSEMRRRLRRLIQSGRLRDPVNL